MKATEHVLDPGPGPNRDAPDVATTPSGLPPGRVPGITPPMVTATIRWVLKFAAILLVGPLAGMLVGGLRAPDGGSGATLLINDAPVMGLVMGLLAIGLATAFGIITARLSTLRLGMFTMGVVLAWAAWSTGHLDAIVRHSNSGGVMFKLAAEGLIVGAASLAGAWAVVMFGGRGKEERGPLINAQTPAAIGGAVLAGAAAGWIIARSELVGQTVGAAIAAGLVGITVGRVVAMGTNVVTLIGGALLLAVLGPLAGAFMHGSDLAASVYSGEIAAIARIMPLDWAAGIMIGAPIGTTWAASLTEKHTEKMAAAGESGGV